MMKEKVIEEITDKMKKFAHAPVQTWKGWSPMTCSGLILNLRWVQDLNRDNVPCLTRMPDITMLIPLNCGLYQDDAF
jgi:hypothetical protein